MADKDTKDQQDTIVAVGPGSDEDDQQDVAGARSDESDRAGAAGDDYRYDEGEEERAGHAADEPDDQGGGDGQSLTREQKRRQRKREKHQRDQRELSFLRTRNEQLEREQSRRMADIETRQTQSDVLAIDSRISQAENDIREAESLYVQARRNNDPEAEAEALRVKDQLREGLGQLKATKNHAIRTARERQQQAAQPPGLPPEVIARAQDWVREHNWFDPKLQDEDSAIAHAIERRVFNEGRLDPTSDAYWEEVDRRIARRLPERYANGRDRPDPDDDDFDDDEAGQAPRSGRNNGRRAPERRASGPTIKVGGRERPLKKGEVFIDADRKNAMIEAGVWDDPEQRARFLKSYQKYDRDAGRRPR